MMSFLEIFRDKHVVITPKTFWTWCFPGANVSTFNSPEITSPFVVITLLYATLSFVLSKSYSTSLIYTLAGLFMEKVFIFSCLI